MANSSTIESEQLPPVTPRLPPYKPRQNSLADMHQKLEEEEEGQVNRLLVQIQREQEQIWHENSPSQHDPNSSRFNDDAATSISTRASVGSALRSEKPTPAGALSRSPSYPRHPRSSFASSHSRRSSYGLGPADGGHGQSSILSSSIDNLQAETQMINRENQMLRRRIKELEAQLAASNNQGPNISSPCAASVSQPSKSETVPPRPAAQKEQGSPASIKKS